MNVSRHNNRILVFNEFQLDINIDMLINEGSIDIRQRLMIIIVTKYLHSKFK